MDSNNLIKICGHTESSNFPTQDPVQSLHSFRTDIFASTIDYNTPTLLFSSYMGGRAYDYARDIAVSRGGDIVVVGQTVSADFPTVNAGQPVAPSPDYDGFIFRIRCEPVGSFSFTSQFACKDTEICFDLTGSSPFNSCEWNFGDGTMSTEQSPCHSYSHAGTYPVELKLTNDYETSSITKPVTVTNSVPEACFTQNWPKESDAPLYVCFDASCSEYEDKTYIWNVGYGDINAGQEFCHNFDSPDIHDVSLTVENDCGSATMLQKCIPSREQYDKLQLARKFAPILFICEDDPYLPNDVSVLMSDADLRQHSVRGWMDETISTRPNISIFDLPTFWGEDYYLDVIGKDPAESDASDTYRAAYEGLAGKDNPKLYVHVLDSIAGDGEADGDGCSVCTVVQYWFFYYFNDWWNLHEGDWELVQVTLDQERGFDPVRVTYSQHTGRPLVFWI